MENFVLTQLSVPEIRQLFRQELQTFFDSNPFSLTQSDTDELLTIQQAAELIKLSIPTVYGLVSRSAIPVSKKNKRLYFSKQELTEWVKAGRKKTNSEIQAEAQTYIAKQKLR